MTAWVALLRAVNVGGTGKIAMDDLRACVQAAGFTQVRTYIASGNLLFACALGAAEVRATLHGAMAAQFGAAPDLVLRTGEQVAALVAGNPFADAPGNKVIVVISDSPLSPGDARHQTDEQLFAGEGALYIHYPSGQGRSKLVMPALKTGTGRNINTLTKLAAMARETD